MFTANSDAVISVSPVASGVGFIPSLIEMRVEGPAGIIQDWITLVSTTAPSDPAIPSMSAIVSNDVSGLVITIPGPINALTAPATKEGRLVSLRMTSTGLLVPIIQVVEYLVIDAAHETQELVLMTNSFQSYPESLVYADSVPDLKAWSTTDYGDKIRAMEQAYYFLSRMHYEIYYDRDDVYFKNRASWGLPWINTIGNLYNYKPTDFLNLDPDFIKAIRTAQVVEADERLGGDPLDDLRDQGVTQHTVGDTSASFRTTPPLRMSVSKRALKYLHGYVKYAPRTIRS